MNVIPIYGSANQYGGLSSNWDDVTCWTLDGPPGAGLTPATNIPLTYNPDTDTAYAVYTDGSLTPGPTTPIVVATIDDTAGSTYDDQIDTWANISVVTDGSGVINLTFIKSDGSTPYSTPINNPSTCNLRDQYGENQCLVCTSTITGSGLFGSSITGTYKGTVNATITVVFNGTFIDPASVLAMPVGGELRFSNGTVNLASLAAMGGHVVFDSSSLFDTVLANRNGVQGVFYDPNALISYDGGVTWMAGVNLLPDASKVLTTATIPDQYGNIVQGTDPGYAAQLAADYAAVGGASGQITAGRATVGTNPATFTHLNADGTTTTVTPSVHNNDVFGDVIDHRVYFPGT